MVVECLYMNDERFGRGEHVIAVTEEGAAVETSQEHELGNRIDVLMSLMQKALQRDHDSPLSQYLASTVGDIALARFRLGDTVALKQMVDTVTDKLQNIDAQTADYHKMIDALTTDSKTTSSPTALFYHEHIRKLEAIKEELDALNAKL